MRLEAVGRFDHVALDAQVLGAPLRGGTGRVRADALVVPCQVVQYLDLWNSAFMSASAILLRC